MGSHLPALTFNGVVVHDQGEMLCLTDLWRAAGSVDAKRPADWLALTSSIEFCAAVEAAFNAEKSGIIRGERGRTRGTWGHWQIALAYAKYLDHDFHMWCNEAVRARMEGRPPAASATGLARRTSASELRLSHDYWHRISLAAGLDPNQALISTNRIVRRVTGVDVMAEMGIAALVAPQQEPILTPTDIGRELDGLSGIAVNARLAERGLQEGKRDAKDRPYWIPTEAGAPYAVFLDTGKKHGDGTPVRQLKWLSSVVGLLRAETVEGAL